MEGEHGQRTQRGYALEREGQESRGKLNSLALDLERAAARQRTNEERCAELEARSVGMQAEVGQAEQQAERLRQELEAERGALESAHANVAGAQEELQQRQQEAAAASASLVEVERQQSSGGMRCCKPSRRRLRCAMASPKPKSGWRRWSAKRGVCATKPLPPINNWKALAGSADSLAWSLKPPRSASPRWRHKSAKGGSNSTAHGGKRSQTAA